MASFTLVVEDGSPLISYSPAGAWDDIVNDDVLLSYSGRSLHSTATRGATANFTFNGTGVKFFGAYRPGYGAYTLTVDGVEVANGNAESATLNVRQTLGAVSGLEYGEHTAVLTAVGDGTIDLDWIEMETRVGPDGSKVSAETIDDSNSRISYLPTSESWALNQSPIFMGGGIHFSNNPAASASLTFTGDAVAIYGAVSPDHADVRITINGQDRSLRRRSSNRVNGLHPQVLMYWADNLGPGEHTLAVSRSPTSLGGPFIDLDSVAVFSSVPVNNEATLGAGNNGSTGALNNNSLTGSSPSRPNTTTSVPVRAIVGAVMGGVLGLLLIIGLALFFLFRKRKRASMMMGLRSRLSNEKSPLSPDLPMQKTPVAFMEAGFAPGPQPAVSFSEFSASRQAPPLMPMPMFADRHSIAPSYYGAMFDEPGDKEVPPLPLARENSRSSAISNESTVPILNQPVPPKRALTSAGKGNGPPIRPSKRPPTLNFS